MARPRNPGGPGKVWEEGGSEVPRGRPERILGVPWELHSGMMRQVGLTLFFAPDLMAAWKRLGAILEPSWAPHGRR